MNKEIERNLQKGLKNNDKLSNSKDRSSPFKSELLDEILKDYNHENPEELIGNNGLLKQLKKAIIERALEGEMTHHLGPCCKKSKNFKIFHNLKFFTS